MNTPDGHSRPKGIWVLAFLLMAFAMPAVLVRPMCADSACPEKFVPAFEALLGSKSYETVELTFLPVGIFTSFLLTYAMYFLVRRMRRQ